MGVGDEEERAVGAFGLPDGDAGGLAAGPLGHLPAALALAGLGVQALDAGLLVDDPEAGLIVVQAAGIGELAGGKADLAEANFDFDGAAGGLAVGAAGEGGRKQGGRG